MNTLYTVNKLADILGVSHTLIRRWCKQEKIEYGLKDGKIVFSEDMAHKIKSWYLNSKPKNGRPNKPENIFCITDISRKLNLEPEIIKQDILLNKIPFSKSTAGSIYFTKDNLDVIEAFYAIQRIQHQYTPNEVEKDLSISADLIRYLCKLNRIPYTLTTSGRYLFTSVQVEAIKIMLNSDIPILDDVELEDYENSKKNYYGDWYSKNKEQVKQRRKQRKNKK